jgi:hypothetical protein
MFSFLKENLFLEHKIQTLDFNKNGYVIKDASALGEQKNLKT